MFYFLKWLMSVPKSKQTHVLPSYGPVSYKFNEIHFLKKVPSGMRLHLKVPKLNERPQTKYHNYYTLGGVKYLNKSRTKYFQKSWEKQETTEENQYKETKKSISKNEKNETISRKFFPAFHTLILVRSQCAMELETRQPESLSKKTIQQ